MKRGRVCGEDGGRGRKRRKEDGVQTRKREKFQIKREGDREDQKSLPVRKPR